MSIWIEWIFLKIEENVSIPIFFEIYFGMTENLSLDQKIWCSSLKSAIHFRPLCPVFTIRLSSVELAPTILYDEVERTTSSHRLLNLQQKMVIISCFIIFFIFYYYILRKYFSESDIFWNLLHRDRLAVVSIGHIFSCP